MAPAQYIQLDRVRAMLARAANSDAIGEQESAARMAMAFMDKYSFQSGDLFLGIRGSTEQDYVLKNYLTAKKILETLPKIFVVDSTPPPKAKATPPPFPGSNNTKHVWVDGYTRKNGTKVKGYWRLTRPVWVESYTRKDGKKVAGYWRFSDLRAAA